MASLLAVMGFVIVRYRSRLITGLATRWVSWRGVGSATQERVLIVGGGETGHLAAWMLNQGQYAAAYRVIGFVDDDLYKQGVRIHGINVLGQRLQIPALVTRYDVGMIIFAIHNISVDERRQVLEICWSTPAKVMLFPDIPAALINLERSESLLNMPADQPGAKATSAEKPSTFLHGDLYLAGVSPFEVDSWLAQLEEVARSGDVERVLGRIREFRQLIQGGEPAQFVENPGEENSQRGRYM
jgi:CoA-binding domain